MILQSPPSVRPLRYLLNHWTKSNQIRCVSCSHEWGAQRHIFCPTPWGLGEGSNGQISLNIIKFQLHSKFQRLLTKLCVSSQTRKYKAYQTGFSFGRLGHAPVVGLGGTVCVWGGGVGGHFLFSEIQPDLVCELLT